MPSVAIIPRFCRAARSHRRHRNCRKDFRQPPLPIDRCTDKQTNKQGGSGLQPLYLLVVVAEHSEPRNKLAINHSSRGGVCSFESGLCNFHQVSQMNCCCSKESCPRETLANYVTHPVLHVTHNRRHPSPSYHFRLSWGEYYNNNETVSLLIRGGHEGMWKYRFVDLSKSAIMYLLSGQSEGNCHPFG